MNGPENPQSDYIIAAYIIAAVFLLGLLAASWRGYRRQQKEWQRLKAAPAQAVLRDPS